MASSKTKGRAAAAAAPAPVATARPALPEGFELITDDDGDELERPTPARAVADLLVMLSSISAWERFPVDHDEWTASQVRERLVPLPGRVKVAGVDQDGTRFEIEKRADRLEALLREWERRTGRRRVRGRHEVLTDGSGQKAIRQVVADEPRVRRCPIDARRQLVHGLRPGLEVFVPQAIKAVVAAGGSAAPLRELERDDELHADTVAAAVAELRKLAVPAVEADASAPPLPQPSPAPMPDLGHEERQTLGALREGPLETYALDKSGSTKRARARLRSWLIEQCGNGSSKRGYWRLLPDGRAVLARMDAGE